MAANRNSDIHISPKGLDFIKSFEGLELNAYKDSGGVWTIGYGSTKYADGRAVKMGNKITEQQALQLFAATMPKYEQMVRNRVTRSLSQNEFDAAVSFAYNAGTGYWDGTKTKDYAIWQNMQNGMTGEEMRKYWSSLAITAGGKKLNGLIRRRKAEVELYLSK